MNELIQTKTNVDTQDGIDYNKVDGTMLNTEKKTFQYIVYHQCIE